MRTKAPTSDFDAAQEPIAIIGLGCRFPGAEGPRQYWRLLCEGVDAIREIPADRWDVERYYDPRPGVPGKMVSREGGFLPSVDQFDAEFFRISPREAVRMDPQQRLLLEVAWEALEDGGQVPGHLAGHPVGVFMGISSNDYGRVQSYPSLSDAYMATGNATSIAANRISFFFDFRGPSAMVDTACSSALVAVYLACRAIWNGEASLALAGGANVLLSPTNSINFSQAGMLSPDGRSKSFDASANGYVRGEGAGVVVLKPLSRAQADGDRIYALIRGGATNQDGRTSGLTVPSQDAQERVIREACRRAGVSPGQLDYVEAHGTGTSVGDPIEARALGAALSVGRDPESVCAVGSCKTNIGHLESAAGVAGIIKTALALHHGEIPPSLHFHEPNPLIPFAELRLRVQTERGPWPDRGRPSLAGVNSFGFGGTNAHIVLEQPPSPPRRPARGAAQGVGPCLLSVSAHTPEALRALARSYAQATSPEGDDGDVEIRDLCYTASLRRAHHEHRLAVVARDRSELHERLSAWLDGEARPGTSLGALTRGASERVVFVFPGQGPQWWGMGRGLLKNDRVFREVLEECDALFRRHASWSLVEELEADESRSRITETEFAQPALFGLQLGLAALWRDRGVTPDAVVGHSMGEVAAAHLAGALSLADAVRVIFHRSRLMQEATGRGRMAAVELSLEDAALALRGYEDRVAIAASNSPTSTVVSGEPDALEEILQELQTRDVFFRYLPVNYAFHSHQMEPYALELERELADIAPRPSRIPVFSTVTGRAADDVDFGAGYWARNLRQTVRFSAAMTGLVDEGFRVFLELGPHPTLAGAISQCLRASGVEGASIASLRRGEDDEEVLLAGLGALYASGCEIDWRQLYREGGRLVTLPAYPWHRERHWLELDGEDITHQAWAPTRRASRHPFLGKHLESSHPTWRVELTGDRLDYLRDHRVQESPLLPGAAYLEMALAAGRELLGNSAKALTDCEFVRPLPLSDGSNGDLPPVEIVLTRDDDDSATFEIASKGSSSGDDGPPVWTRHASGRIHRLVGAAEPVAPDPARLDEIRRRCVQEVAVEPFYRQLAQLGLSYGPSFRGVRELWRGASEALARVSLPADLLAEVGDYQLHPSVLDSCFQALAAASGLGEAEAGPRHLYLPTGVARARIYEPAGPSLWAHVRLVARPGSTESQLEGEVRLFEDGGRLVAEVHGLRLQRFQGETASDGPRGDSFYELAWEPRPRPGETLPPVTAGTLPSPSELREQLEEELTRLTAQQALARYDFDKNERWADAYVSDAFRKLGWDPRPGETFSREDLQARMRIAPRHRQLFRRLLSRMEAAGILARVEETWTVRAPLVEDDPERLYYDLLADNPGAQADLSLQRRCGARLADVLRGDCDPLELIFPGGSMATAERFYEDSPFNLVFARLTRRTVSAAVAKLPQDRVLRVLEIGAGTGGTTAHVLPELQSARVDYVYTDVSPAFTSHGAAKFSSHPACRFQLLDIEKNPVDQGFTPHSFDIVIASYVLHATADLRTALANTAMLLSEGGLLVMTESTGPMAMLDLVFALTEGWWRFEDVDLRGSYPLLPEEDWLRLIADVGLGDGVAVPGERRLRSKQTLLMARGARAGRAAEAERAALTTAAAAGPKAPETWLLFGGETKLDEHLGELLGARRARTIVVVSGSGYARLGNGRFQIHPDSPEDFRRLLDECREQGPPCRGVVYLWGAGTKLSRSASLQSLEKAESLALGGALHLVQALAGLGAEAPRLWLVTRAVAHLDDEASAASIVQAPLHGLMRVLTNEHPELRCTVVDLSPRSSAAEIRSLAAELQMGDEEREVALRGTRRWVHRARRYHSDSGRRRRLAPSELSFRLEVARPGVLDSFVLRVIPTPRPQAGQVGIRVQASGMNFLDVLSAMGLYPGRAPTGPIVEIGMECAGTVTALGDGVDHLRVGDEVIAVAPFSFGTDVVSTAPFAIRKPSGLTFEEAATIPVAFLTAYYALVHLGRVQRGERVLVHSASGGVGLAALQLARRAGAEIFATAGSPLKREYLRALGVEHVMDSRSLDFVDEILEDTKGTGVDLVLNSLTGEAIQASLSLLKPNGRFLEIGKKDIYQNSRLGLSTLRENRSFHAVDLIPLFTEQPELSGSMFRQIGAWFESGELSPLPYRAFDSSNAEEAFRYMAQAKHIGKVLLTPGPGDASRVAPAAPPPLELSADGTYLVTGGLGGFGLLVAEWMVDRGARSLVLVGRSATLTEPVARALERMRGAGARVEVVRADVSERNDVARVMRGLRATMPELRGILHAAMVLEDASVLQLTRSGLKKAMAPKLMGAWNLHKASLEAPLDFFVLFGSMASIVGSPGQANYVAANEALDALAHYRRALGLPAMAIDWGRIGEVGYVARHQAVAERLDALGVLPMPPRKALAALEKLLSESPVRVAVVDADWRATRRVLDVALLSQLFPQADAAAGEDARHSLLETLHGMPSAERQAAVETYLRGELSRVLRLDPSRIDPAKRMTSLGLDSLMAYELKARIESDAGITLPMVKLVQGPSVAELGAYLVSQLESAGPAATSGSAARAGELHDLIGDGDDRQLMEKLDGLSDDQVDSLLSDLAAGETGSHGGRT